MKHTKTLWALFVVLTLAAAPKQATAAFHFSAVAPTGQTLYYKIIADSTRQVRLTYPQVSDDHEDYYYGYPKPTGVLAVPDSVEHEGVWYRVTRMSGQTFMGCDSLTEVTLPSTISEISMNAFNGCTQLTKVNLPGSIEEIQSFAFRECSSLESIDLPEGLRVIWGQAFCLCTSLRRVHLPSTLVEIKPYAFSSSDAIDTVWIAATVPPLCGDSQYPQWPAFTATGSVLVVPCGTEEAYRNAYGWDEFVETTSECGGFESYFGQDSTRWNCLYEMYDVGSQNNLLRTGGDTLIEGTPYKKIEYSQITTYNGYHEFRVPSYDFLLREDTLTGRLWFRKSTGGSDILISDMTLSIGDAYTYRLHDYDYPMDYIVTRIDTLNGLRSIHLEEVHHNIPPIQMTEGVGPSFLNSCNCEESWIDTWTLCCHKDGDLFFHQSPNGGDIDGCIVHYEGIEEWRVENGEWRVYVRNGRITVEGADGERVQVFDMKGRAIRNETLPTGVYMVKVGHRAARRVMVVR